MHTKWFKEDNLEIQTATMEEAVTYQDVLLVPQYSDIISRSEVDIGSSLSKDLRLDLPVISSPMDTVSEDEMASAMSQNGGMSVVHRYNSIEEQASLIRKAIDSGATVVGGAVGVTGNFEERANAIVGAGAKVICIDVAHGHHILVKKALETLRNEYDNHIYIIAGNVCTLEGINDVADWGADAVRCNIGGGSICSTRIVTGHGLPGLQTIFD